VSSGPKDGVSPAKKTDPWHKQDAVPDMPAHARLHLYQNQAKMEEIRWRGSFPIRVPVQPEDKPHLFLGNEELPPVKSRTTEHPSK